jgi:hypothetical protein
METIAFYQGKSAVMCQLLGADTSTVGAVQGNELVGAVLYYGKSDFAGCYITRNFLSL